MLFYSAEWKKKVVKYIAREKKMIICMDAVSLINLLTMHLMFSGTYN